MMITQQPSRGDEGTANEPTEEMGSPADTASVLPLPVATSLCATQTAQPIQEERAIDEQLIWRIENLPKEAGWALITAGVVGVIVPGVAGVPFLVAGAFVLIPGGPRLFSRWASRKPRKRVHSALRQMCRMLDDLERRYPSVRGDAPPLAVDHYRHLDVQ
jgi:hypothetical protein